MTSPAASAYDVVVIGGGAAGLSGALALGRARRRVLVLDDGTPRNAPADGVHTLLGHEGVAPLALLATGREEVARYGVETVSAAVAGAERTPEGFRVVLADGTSVGARRLLVTTGLTDVLPDVPGLADRWGREVLHCPYCHGWEVRDLPLGVLGTGPLSFHQALMWRQWSDDLTLFLHAMPELTDEQAEQLDARGVTVVRERVARLAVADDRLTGVALADGRVVPVEALAVTPLFTARTGFLDGLGLVPVERERGGQVVGTVLPVDETGATPVPGVWAAGNVTNPSAQVVGAADAGVRAGAAINADLTAEETAAAVAARRAAREWDERYAQSERVWSGEPNTELVRHVTALPPGRALDLGCGEGGDAVWLASRGWRVTAVDVSRVALGRAARHAADAGVADRIDWQRHDLATSFPAGSHDLVSAQFLYSLTDMPRERILRSAAAAVAPGGVLLIEGHAGLPHWEDADAHGDIHLPTPDEVVASLRLPAGEWEVLVSEEHERTQLAPDGTPAVRTDNTVMLRRLPR
ncbi:bifunctional NAD(P)/FAD-dependent oxidoreductase/class I SAM-dependent methyltransferase [Streptomyces avicenniae]|uniref:bifunctional NAD(P)/FAD-dependent oxidoreductase/class I SAM-dependent methyltransferase n=1 Tax=Streptomyces avicenniae TaxID=500153 RepID=UPI00069CACAC|nr:bifunctional NAD(P)/FAD-dependent oxidoreductase/class I SAM-dependent methyltransferase [Streptomyces avicenniae]